MMLPLRLRRQRDSRAGGLSAEKCPTVEVASSPRATGSAGVRPRTTHSQRTRAILGWGKVHQAWPCPGLQRGGEPQNRLGGNPRLPPQPIPPERRLPPAAAAASVSVGALPPPRLRQHLLCPEHPIVRPHSSCAKQARQFTSRCSRKRRVGARTLEITAGSGRSEAGPDNKEEETCAPDPNM